MRLITFVKRPVWIANTLEHHDSHESTRLEARDN